MKDLPISDLEARKLALDPNSSFIVQAPAGSGKTSLLVQRYLKLLSQVNNPEEIIAITFTRKAAFEMRDRIINALKNVDKKISTKDQYKTTTQKLAKEAIKQNEIKKWNIIQNPSRLRIQTIDAFCYYLVNSSPIFTEINSNLQIVQNQEAEIYYQKAAHLILENTDNPQYSHHLEYLLLHLGNDWERATNLFVTLLKSREQWLPHITGLKNTKELRQKMEQSLKEISQENLERAISFFPKSMHQELIKLLEFSKNNHENPSAFSYDLEFKENSTLNLNMLRGAANILLTKEFSWRKKITKANGFPTLDSKHTKAERKFFKSMKTRMEMLLTQLSENENLRLSLENLLLSPPPNYTDQQWQLVDALLELLPLLAAYLKVIFNEEMATDHAEISMAALRILGTEESPSDFALNLDYRLQHLLIDEFQDTSMSHYRLIEKLTTTWQEDDGHTIFIVGDPMQSIYRFREAEVGLFLRVQHEGINNLKLNSITLSTNFRSSSNIIKWINENFTKIMPALEDVSLGAVPFKSSIAIDNNPLSDVQIELLQNGNINNEAEHLIAKVKRLSKEHPSDSIAILVKARSHLKKLITVLNQDKIDYQAVELETLQKSLVIRDLFSITRALFDLADRIAWIAVLRAPWCGLNLEDLHKVANSKNELIWYNICSYQTLNLSKDGKTRLAKFIAAITPILDLKGRLTWRELVEKTWLMIGGPATVNDEIELEHAEVYLELLDEPFNITIIEKKLNTLYNSPKTTNSKIQLITIHKAKGLEFDHVIIPGINRATKSDEQKLLLWFERPKLHRGSSLILAPIATNDDKKPIYQYLKSVEQKKNFYETSRLLYVAMTRAKKTITLLGNVKKANNNLLNIQSGSLLEQLTPCFAKNWLQEIPAKKEMPIAKEKSPPKLFRLTQDWQSPITIDLPLCNNSPDWNFTDNRSAILGTVIHKILYQISKDGLENWSEKRISQEKSFWHKLLQQTGYIDLAKGLSLITEAIKLTIKDKRGRWILTSHQDNASELAITTKTDNRFETYIIDRTFIDENGTRWIIDYKTSYPDQQNIEQFLSQEKIKHTPKLYLYRKAMLGLDPSREIKLGLYFPLFNGWIENGA